MNKRQLNCCDGIIREVYAIGQEGSFSDYKEKVKACFQCYNNITCKGFYQYLILLAKQNKNINSLSSKV